MKKYFSVCVMAIALGAMCGCEKSSVESEVETEVATNATESVAFDIPRTLYERMFDLYDENRTKELMPNEIFDPDEMFGLMECGLASNAVEIVKRPRGKMCFVDDLCTDEERRELWPFELAAFEATLEAKMKIGEQGYQLVDDDGKLQARNPTVRWLNAEMDAWAVKQLDDKFERMSADTYCKMFEEDVMPEGMDAWRIDEVYYLVIDRSSEGAWCPRSYDVLIWAEGREPTLVAAFDSFPNAKEAIAALCFHCDAAAIHNLAVLEWQHRIHRHHMNPYRIEAYLKKAKMLEVPTADANLKVLYEHIPELTKEFN